MKSMKSYFVAAAVALISSNVLAEEVGVFIPGKFDTTVKALFTSWAKKANAKVIWQADVDRIILDSDKLVREARLDGRVSFDDAIGRTIELVNKSHSNLPIQLRACVYMDFREVVIRTSAQPDCGQPLK